MIEKNIRCIADFLIKYNFGWFQPNLYLDVAFSIKEITIVIYIFGWFQPNLYLGDWKWYLAENVTWIN